MRLLRGERCARPARKRLPCHRRRVSPAHPERAVVRTWRAPSSTSICARVYREARRSRRRRGQRSQRGRRKVARRKRLWWRAGEPRWSSDDLCARRRGRQGRRRLVHCCVAVARRTRGSVVHLWHAHRVGRAEERARRGRRRGIVLARGRVRVAVPYVGRAQAAECLRRARHHVVLSSVVVGGRRQRAHRHGARAGPFAIAMVG